MRRFHPRLVKATVRAARKPARKRKLEFARSSGKTSDVWFRFCGSFYLSRLAVAGMP